MATSQKLTEHFLKCSVCTGLYKDPCSLECTHTFCRECVVNFTVANEEAVKAGCIPCPTCRRWMKVSDPSQPVEHWPDGMRALHLVHGLMDTFGPDGKDTEHCTWCKDRGETTPAVHWCDVCDEVLCEGCVQTHRRLPATRHHDVTEISGPEVKVKVKRKQKIYCKEHKSEVLEYHCLDCEKVICQKCFLTRHRKCDTVVEIATQMDEMKGVLGNKMKNLDKKQDRKETHISERRKEVDQTVENETKLRSELISTRDAIYKSVSRKTDALLANLREATQVQLDELKSAIKTDELDVNMYKQERELLGQAVKSDTAMDVFQVYDKYRKEKNKNDNQVQNTRGYQVIIWENNATILREVDEMKMGQIGFQKKTESIESDVVTLGVVVTQLQLSLLTA